MSWTPDFWIDKIDFNNIKNHLEALDTCNAWEFDLIGNNGIVLSGGNTSSAHRELHDLLSEFEIDHWILNSESPVCDLCHSVGIQVMP